MRGRARVTKAFFEPLPAEDLAAWERPSPRSTAVFVRRLKPARCYGWKSHTMKALASHIVSESCAARSQGRRRSVDRGTRGPGIEPRNPVHLQGADAV